MYTISYETSLETLLVSLILSLEHATSITESAQEMTDNCHRFLPMTISPQVLHFKFGLFCTKTTGRNT